MNSLVSVITDKSLNTKRSLHSGLTPNCKNASLKSIVENILPPAILFVRSTKVGSKSLSIPKYFLTVKRKSPHIRTAPDFFKILTVGVAQVIGVFVGSTFSITPSSKNLRKF
ncbi:unnamed protein product [Gordionus sp. m RMFG-2023]